MGVCACRDRDHSAFAADPPRGAFLKKYSSILEEYAKLDPEHHPTREQMEKDLRPVIEGSFKLHDSQGDGILDKDESKIFFHTLVSASSPFSDAKFHAEFLKKPDTKAKSVDIVQVALALANEQHRDEYERHKDAYDAAAFKVIDVTGTGKLRKEDVLEALLPDTELNNRFFEALGIRKLARRSELLGVFLRQYAIELDKYTSLHPSNRSDPEVLTRTLRTYLEHSFSLHDVDGNGVIDNEEAKHYFDSLTDTTSPFAGALKQLQIIRTLSVLNDDAASFSSKALSHKIVLQRGQEEDLMFIIDEQHDCYLRDTMKYNSQAYKVIDTNGDGTLQKEEVVQALLPGTELHDKFLTALGYDKIHAKDFLLG